MATRPSSSCSQCRYERMNEVYSRGADVPTVSLLDASACLLNSISSACAGSVLAASFDMTPRLTDRTGTSADKAGGSEFSGVWLPSPAQDAQSFFTGKRPTFSSPQPEVQSHHPWTSHDAGQEVGLDASRPISPSPGSWQGSAVCREVIERAAK
ncbi:hypothetical protein IG631_08863 [Alternaria alternata]|nr:hypothetical protein IG631_08863 [Alternaria alternata]